ncbi:MAG: HAMP domain-containing protein [Polyangiaceae bacterium]|nr:HAMP domain-containing protein [Polyangiaceae bacterium]
MANALAQPTEPVGRHQRRIRNYLLDRRFQLKYAAYFVCIAALLSSGLGAVLWRTSTMLIAQSQELVRLGQAVVDEGHKVSRVVEMNIVKEYGDNPELLAAFKDGDGQYAQTLILQQSELERQAAALRAQHLTAAYVLGIALGLFVLFVGIAGILVTHRVAGPIHKMRRQIVEVAEGHLHPGGSLRRGDELVEFFEAFEVMVQRLRERQEHEIAMLDVCIEHLAATASEAELVPLRELRGDMRATLDS